MKVAGNKLKQLQAFYLNYLQDQFDEAEIRAIFQTSIQHYLGWSASDQLRRQEDNINQSDLLKIYDCAKALALGRPLQYILKEAWFYGERFSVDSAVLIPRPETEELVDLILKQNKKINSLLDIGTGSGCIPITIKRQRPEAMVIACDLSELALQMAEKNAFALNSEVEFIKADALSTEFHLNFSNTFQILVSNPPYILASEALSMSKQVLDHEPHLALFAEGEDASIFYKKIIAASRFLLAPQGQVYFELNPLTADDVKAYAEASGIFTHVEILQDMSGKARFMRLVKN
jgi:release factor glutamine methyltransferase